MDATLAVSCDSLAEDDLQSLTRELSTTLNRETDVAAAMPEARPEPGSRGDPAILHTLLLTFMTSGAAVAMFQVIKSYVERNKSLTMTIKWTRRSSSHGRSSTSHDRPTLCRPGRQQRLSAR